MAKRYLLFAAGALALTACTSEEVINDVAASRNQIQFDNVVDKMSRATDLTLGTLQHFNVFGFYTMPENPNMAHKVFDNVTVTNDGTGKWSYDNQYAQYWVGGATYYFYAYSCGSSTSLTPAYGDFALDIDDPKDGEGKKLEDRVMEIDNYVCDQSHQHDLIFATNTTLAADKLNTNVSFQFKHVLSKLMANFTSGFTEEYDVIIKNVSVRNIRNTGNYNFKTGWQDPNRTEFSPLVYLLNTNATENPDNELTVTNKLVNGIPMSVSTNTAFVIPFEYQAADVNLYFEVDVMYGKEYVIKSKPLTATFKPEWEEGFSYVYNINVSPESISMEQINFTVESIKDWEIPNPSSTDLTIDK